MMAWIVDLLKRHGLHDIATILYHQPEVITSCFGDGSAYDVKMSYVTADRDFGTAGAVKYSADVLDSTFIVISGDVLTDFDLTAALRFHKQKKSTATILLTRVENPLQYGIVFTDKDGVITRFFEKPSWGEVFSDRVNTGIYIFEPEVLDYIPGGQMFDFSRNLFPLLMKKGVPLYGYEAEGYWRDIGDIAVYRQSHREVLDGMVKLKFKGRWRKAGDGRILLQKGAVLEEGAHLEGVNILGENAVLKTGASLVNSVVGSDCEIGNGSYVRNSILWPSVRVGEYSHATEAVVASESVIGARSFLMEESLISEGCRIGDGSTLRAGVKLWPDRSVEEGSVVTSSLVWGQRWQKQIFSDSRVTGLTNSELNPEFAAKLGAAVGSQLGQGLRVVIARDPHPASHMISEAVIAGLLSTGVHVSNLRMIPKPLLSFAVRQGEGVIGIYTRRSPFERKKSDVIFVDDKGSSLGPARIQGIERLFFREDYRRADIEETGSVEFPYHVVPAYRSRFLSMIDTETLKLHPMKVVLDYSYSLASNVFPPILSELGCEVIGINAHPDTDKSVRTRKGFARALLQLSEIVKSIRADLGILMDTGGEKIFLVDEKGTILTHDQALCCYTRLMLDSGAEKLAFSIASSEVVKRMCEEEGATAIFTPDTIIAMLNAATENGADVVAGRKGGYIFPAFMPVFDAMYSTATLLSQLATQRTKLSRVLKRIPVTFLTRENINCPSTKKGWMMRKLLEKTSGMDRILVDGIKLRTKYGWILVRPDSYRPILHVDVEADTPERTEKEMHRIKSLIESLD